MRLHIERAHDAEPVDILARRERRRVEPPLTLRVERDRLDDDREDDERQRQKDPEKDERPVDVDEKRHDDRAEDDDRRAQRETQRKIQTRLHLIRVVAEPRRDRVGPEPVELRL